jgi:hypothetical protein
LVTDLNHPMVETAIGIRADSGTTAFHCASERNRMDAFSSGIFEEGIDGHVNSRVDKVQSGRGIILEGVKARRDGLIERRSATRAGIVMRDAGGLTRRMGGRVIEQIEVGFDRAQMVAGIDVYTAGKTMTLFMLGQLLRPGGELHVVG